MKLPSPHAPPIRSVLLNLLSYNLLSYSLHFLSLVPFVPCLPLLPLLPLLLLAPFAPFPQVAQAQQVTPIISIKNSFFTVLSGVTITDIQHLPNDPHDRLFVLTQNGQIHILRNFRNGIEDGTVTKDATPFLDITPVPYSQGGERGLLGLAFDPNYERNGYFYVNYSWGSTTQYTRISRFTASMVNSNYLDSNSSNRATELILETIIQDFSNHNGGQLQFLPGTNYLYVGMGDGGGAGDPNNRASGDPTSLLGKMLRYRVSNGGEYIGDGSTYQWEWSAAGSSNLIARGFNETIWHYGLRNPWRYSFDRSTGDMFVADVGQSSWEEVTFLPYAEVNGAGGETHGWKYCEGSYKYPSGVSDSVCDGTTTSEFLPNYVPPIFEYRHTQDSITGCSITGGYVYRGTAFPSLGGIYFYADYCLKWIRGAVPTSNGDWTTGVNRNFVLLSGLFDGPTTFGEDKYGELYVGFYNGHVARIHGPAAPAPTTSPTKTSSPSASGEPTGVPIGMPTRAPFAIGVECPSTYDNVRSLSTDATGPTSLTLRYSIVPDPEASSSYGGLFCAQLVYQGTASWLGLGISGCSPGQINSGNCNKMSNSEVVVADPNDDSISKYKLYLHGANLMDGQTLFDTTVVDDGSQTTVTYTKFLKETNEFEISATSQNLFVFAIGGENQPFPQVHATKGYLILDQTPCPINACNGGQICQPPPCSTCNACSTSIDCQSTTGCTYTPGGILCSGSTNSCSQCTTAALCAQAGCNWLGGRCKGGSQTPQAGSCSGTAIYTCPPNSICGDATCDVGETSCNCPNDCGNPPSTEVVCTGGIDEDCDGLVDCDDLDCKSTASCASNCVSAGGPCPSDQSLCCNKSGCKGKVGQQTCK